MDFALRIAAIVIGCLVVVSFFRSITRTTLLRSRRGDVLVASTHFVLAVIFRVIGRRARGSKLDSTTFWYIPVSEFTLMFVWSDWPSPDLPPCIMARGSRAVLKTPSSPAGRRSVRSVSILQHQAAARSFRLSKVR